MYIQESYKGPVQVTVRSSFTVAELKKHVQYELEIPNGVQKWICQRFDRNSFLNPDWNFKFTLDMFFEFGNCESGLDCNLYWTVVGCSILYIHTEAEIEN